jgi:hypothetical protein
VIQTPAPEVEAAPATPTDLPQSVIDEMEAGKAALARHSPKAS